MNENTEEIYIDNLTCSVCLKGQLGGVKLASQTHINMLRTLSLEIYFTDTKVHLCLHCAAVLRKCSEFVKQCWRVSATWPDKDQAILGTEGHFNNLSTYRLESFYIGAKVATDINVTSADTIKYEDADDGSSVTGDVHFDDDDDVPLTVWSHAADDKIEVEISGTNISFDAVKTNACKEDKVKHKKQKKRNRKLSVNQNDTPCLKDAIKIERHESDGKSITTKLTLDEKVALSEDSEGRFSKRMVRETDQYTVIKLTNDEVKEEMKERRASDRYMSFTYKCDLCAKGFNFEEVLKNHMERHSKKNGELRCMLCYQYCPSVVSLRGHMKSHTTRYKCKVCGCVRLSRQHLLEHYSISHCAEAVVYRCEQCHFTTNKRTVVQRHTRSHGAVQPRVCETCGFVCKTLEALRVHTTRHDSSKRYECKQCSSKFVYPSLLRKHERLVHINRDNYCVECHVYFKSMASLRNHFKRSQRHRGKSLNMFKCKICGDEFKERQQLVSHRNQTHPHERTHACQLCTKRYYMKDSLRSHVQRVHNVANKPQRKYACELCDKTFTQRGSLTRHGRVHTGERPFACGECSLRFAQRATRDTHRTLVHRLLPRGKKQQEVLAQKTQEAATQQSSQLD